MGTFRSKEDDVAKISISVFVTNFPDSISSKDLFNACKQYGHVVDSFIATKRSKAGKRFGFVRFINVFSVDRLVNNLCTVWINRHKLHANVARFSRVSEKNPNKTFVSSKPVGASSYAATLKGGIMVSCIGFTHTSAICLDKHLSDHRPILLRHVASDYGATPFRFYHSWFEYKGFGQMVVDTWNRLNLEDKGIMMNLTDCAEGVVKIIQALSDVQFAKGCNSSFIALIPKTPDAKFVGEFRPISLIGSLYKVITKILANRLSNVISDLVADVQTAFLPNRQILDGPFIVNEVLSWCKFKQKQAMVFKVDFAKAYDSVRWDFLDDVLEAFGFGFKWRSWVLGSLSSGMASIVINGSPTAEFKFHCGLKQGFGVSREMVNDAASSLGCAVMRAPFKVFLELWVGGGIVLWLRIGAGENSIANSQGIDLLSLADRVGNGMQTRFWKDHWIGDAPLYDLFPRLFSLEMSGDVTVATKLHGLLSDSFRRPVRGGMMLSSLRISRS
ncbi:RNA-directed DNA polymerase, eukaryota [Tanacetum coccineum]